MYSRPALARIGPASHWVAGLAALLCNAALLGALVTDFSISWRPKIRKGGGELKMFTLPAPTAPKPQPRAAQRSALPRPAAPSAIRPLTPVSPPVEAVPQPLPSAEAIETPSVAPPPSTAVVERKPPKDDRADAAWNAYRMGVWAHIAAHKPSGMHMPGEAVLTFTLGHDGSLIDARIAQSSGNAMLDRLALRTMRAATPFPTPPELIRSRDLQFTIRFSFH